MHVTWGLLSGLLLLGLVTTNNPWLVQLHNGIAFASKRFSGIVGDAAHALRGGYHIGRLIQGLLNYSTSRPLDRLGDGLMSAGYDLGLSPAEMIAGTSRVISGMRSGDPRAAPVREVNGTLDGRTTVNYDVTIHGQNYQPDLTHLWHMHFGFWRGLVCDAVQAQRAIAGLVSLINGEPLAQYLLRTGSTSTTNPTDSIPTPAPVEDSPMLYPVLGGKTSQHPGVVFIYDGQTLRAVPPSPKHPSLPTPRKYAGAVFLADCANRAATAGRLGAVSLVDSTKAISPSSFVNVPAIDDLDAAGLVVWPEGLTPAAAVAGWSPDR